MDLFQATEMQGKDGDRMNKAFEKILERLEDELTSIKTKCYTNVDFDKGIYKAQKIVQEVAEEYKGGWIPCSERLPEEKINPITKDYYVYPVTYRNENIEDVRYYSYGNGHWHHCLQIMDDFVVAWQPLPEPYKECD